MRYIAKYAEVSGSCKLRYQEDVKEDVMAEEYLPVRGLVEVGGQGFIWGA